MGRFFLILKHKIMYQVFNSKTNKIELTGTLEECNYYYSEASHYDYLSIQKLPNYY